MQIQPGWKFFLSVINLLKVFSHAKKNTLGVRPQEFFFVCTLTYSRFTTQKKKKRAVKLPEVKKKGVKSGRQNANLVGKFLQLPKNVGLEKFAT
jgi:hypothetical protein